MILNVHHIKLNVNSTYTTDGAGYLWICWTSNNKVATHMSTMNKDSSGMDLWKANTDEKCFNERSSAAYKVN